MARRKANKKQSPAKATPRSVALSQATGYVAAQAAEGYAHSQGTFTVDESLAAQKLGRYQLAKDGSWILALIQVACRGGASEIRVKIGATRTVVTLRNSRPWSWDELQPAVYQGQALQGEFELSLALVLRFLVARGQEGYGNHVHTPMGESLSLPFGAVHRASPGLGGRFRPGDATFELDHTPPASKESKDRERRAELYHQLVAGGLASAIPVFCDGLRISGSFLAGEAFEHTYHQPVAVLPLCVDGIPSLPFPSAQIHSTLGRKAGVRLPGATLRTSPSEPLAGLGVVGVAIRRKNPKSPLSELELSQGRWRVLWVLDGVVVRRKSGELPGSLSFTLLISAKDLPTDLSGLHLVKGNLTAKRFETVVRAFGIALEAVSRNTGGKGFQVSVLSGIIPAAVAAGMVAQGVLHVASGIFTIPAGLSLAKHAYHNWRRMAEWDQQLDADLAELPQRALTALGPRAS